MIESIFQSGGLERPAEIRAKAWPRPEKSPLFRKWTDPKSGVVSWILTQRAAPLQQTFYFTNPSFTNDGRYLWLYCAFPPGGDAYYGRQLAVVDFEAGEVRHYPETLFTDASPYVDVETGEVYWTTGLDFWKRGPRAGDCAQLIGTFPADLARGRRPLRLATHLTRSADGKSLNFDALFGNDCFVGDLQLDGSGARIWQKCDRVFNHGQFSPTDPDLLLVAGDAWHDAATGEPGKPIDRLYLIRRGEKLRPLCPDDPDVSMRGHEWWDADGEHVWFIDYRKGTQKVNIHTGKPVTIWPHGHTHSHNDRLGQYLVGDIAESPSEWQVAFYNLQTRREISIVSHFPVHQAENPTGSWYLTSQTPNYVRSRYHVHPHPQFCCDDQYIAYTTNVLGSVDVALVAVEQLARLTSA